MCASFSDYDAVLTEAGDYTSKFFKLRQLFSAIIGNYKSRSQNAVLAYSAKSETCANWPFCWGPVALVGCLGAFSTGWEGGPGTLGISSAISRQVAFSSFCLCQEVYVG